MVRQDFLGYRYDDAEPAFMTAGAYYFHRVTGKLFGKASLDAEMANAGYTPDTKEVGSPSAAWVANNMGTVAPAAVPPPLPVVTTTGATKGSPGSFAGGTPADLAALIKLGALGNTAAWTSQAVGKLQEYVTLGDTSLAAWSGSAWVAVAATKIGLDITSLCTGLLNPADLATLQSDGTFGDGKGFAANGAAGSGVAFATGQYVVLGDTSKAHYTGTAWAVGATS